MLLQIMFMEHVRDSQIEMCVWCALMGSVFIQILLVETLLMASRKTLTVSGSGP